jgi:hypothetical protein
VSPHLSDHGPNVALLRLTLKHIEMAPCTWDQEHWRRKAPCGTVMCFAGWACALAGGHWYGPADSVYREVLKAEADDEETDNVFPLRLGPVIEAAARARRVLGLDAWQAKVLFRHTNTLPDLHRIVDEICGVAS